MAYVYPSKGRPSWAVLLWFMINYTGPPGSTRPSRRFRSRARSAARTCRTSSNWARHRGRASSPSHPRYLDSDGFAAPVFFLIPQRCRRSFEPALARRRSVSPSPHSRPSRRRHLRHRACFRRRPIHLRCRPCFRHRRMHPYGWNSHPLRPARSCFLRAVRITQGRPKLPPSHFRHPAHAVGTMPRQRPQT